jgi:hypothetical protein
MKASEYIAKLQALIEEHGDLECVTGGHDDIDIGEGPKQERLWLQDDGTPHQYGFFTGTYASEMGEKVIHLD